MSTVPPAAYTAFSLAPGRFTPGRLRLRIPAMRGDKAFFRSLEEEFLGIEGVLQVKGNPATASLLFLHEGEELALLQKLSERGRLSLAHRGSLSHGETRVASLSAAEKNALQTSLFLGLSVLQLIRGFPLAPSSTLFKQAQSYWEKLRHEQERGRI